jgi:hypothetical protein
MTKAGGPIFRSLALVFRPFIVFTKVCNLKHQHHSSAPITFQAFKGESNNTPEKRHTLMRLGATFRLIHEDVTRQRVRAAADKDLSAAMLYDLRFKDVSAVVVKDPHQLTKARVITAEEVVRMRGERQKDAEKAARAAAGQKKKQGATAEGAATGAAKGKEKEVIDQRIC